MKDPKPGDRVAVYDSKNRNIRYVGTVMAPCAAGTGTFRVDFDQKYKGARDFDWYHPKQMYLLKKKIRMSVWLGPIEYAEFRTRRRPGDVEFIEVLRI